MQPDDFVDLAADEVLPNDAEEGEQAGGRRGRRRLGGLRRIARRLVAALDGDALRSSLEALSVALGDAAPAADPGPHTRATERDASRPHSAAT